jgi:hypothetical protein
VRGCCSKPKKRQRWDYTNTWFYKLCVVGRSSLLHLIPGAHF